jgi:hypothetical protein
VVVVAVALVALALTAHLHQQQPAQAVLVILGRLLAIYTQAVAVGQEAQEDHHLPQEVQEDLAAAAMV